MYSISCQLNHTFCQQFLFHFFYLLIVSLKLFCLYRYVHSINSRVIYVCVFRFFIFHGPFFLWTRPMTWKGTFSRMWVIIFTAFSTFFSRYRFCVIPQMGVSSARENNLPREFARDNLEIIQLLWQIFQMLIEIFLYFILLLDFSQLREKLLLIFLTWFFPHTHIRMNWSQSGRRAVNYWYYLERSIFTSLWDSVASTNFLLSPKKVPI